MELAKSGGSAPSAGEHLRVDLDGDGVPRGVSLVMTSGRGAPRVEPVRKPYVVLGRKAPADVVINMAALSRRQCGFDFSTGEVVIEDLDSTCGTYVNGAQVRRAALRAGDEVRVGDLILHVQIT
jgi:pSer/pThr/pTyr-binding forkhead associated (FHA) protein